MGVLGASTGSPGGAFLRVLAQMELLQLLEHPQLPAACGDVLVVATGRDFGSEGSTEQGSAACCAQARFSSIGRRKLPLALQRTTCSCGTRCRIIHGRPDSVRLGTEQSSCDLLLVGLRAMVRIVICSSQFCNWAQASTVLPVARHFQKCLAASPGSCWGVFLEGILSMFACPHTRAVDAELVGITAHCLRGRLPAVVTISCWSITASLA